MSHFSVIVITKDMPTDEDIHSLMAPFQENNMGDCPEEFLEFRSMQDEVLEDWNNGHTKMVHLPNGEKVYPHDSRFRDPSNFSGPRVYPEGAVEKDTPYQEIYKDFHTFAKEHYNYKQDETTGDYGYWENPNAKWDYYTVGGRWKDAFIAKNKDEDAPYGRDACRIGNLALFEMREEVEANARSLYKSAQAEAKKKEGPKGSMLELMFGVDPSKETLEQFVSRRMAQSSLGFSAYAFVTPEGEWVGRGDMGWWGMSSNEDDKYDEKFYDYIMSLNENYWVTNIDCHI